MGLLDLFKRKPAPAPVSTPAPATSRQVAPRQARRYAAARPDRLAGGFSAFGNFNSTAIEARDGLRGLVAHSRKLSQNADYMKAFLKLCRRNIIGPNGILLQNTARDTNGALDRFANQAVEDAWRKWGKVGNATVCGKFSWLDLQHMTATTMPRDGNVLARIYQGPAYGPFGFQLQLLDIDQLAIDKVQGDLPGGGYIDCGIECNALDRPIAYHLYAVHPAMTNRGSREVVRVPASEIIHLFVPEETGQMIGIPWAHTALRRLNLMEGFEEAALTNARAGAAKMGFIESEIDDDVDPGELNGLLSEKAEIQEVAPGEIEELPVGKSFKAYDPKYPDGEMDPFMKLMLRGAAAGLGVAYHSLANDLTGANFSSLHHGVSEERAEWRTLQNFLSSHLHDRVFSAWLPMAILTGQIALPMAKLAKYDAASWKPRGWKAVNPVDEANANKTLMAAGLRSPQDILADAGLDIEDVYEEIAQAKKLAEQYGLSFDLSANGAPAPSSADANDAAGAAQSAQKPGGKQK